MGSILKISKTELIKQISSICLNVYPQLVLNLHRVKLIIILYYIYINEERFQVQS